MTERERKQADFAWLYRDSRWKAVRRQVLERDGHRCQVKGPKCTVVATEVDHIVPVTKGGALLDPANLRAACAKCNRGRRSAPAAPAVSAPNGSVLPYGGCTLDHPAGGPPCSRGHYGPSREW